MESKIKKVRSTNFSKEEELLLADEIYKEKDIIENKTSNKLSNTEKEQAWERVQNCFNSKSYICRSIEQLKSKYDNLKTKARRVIANERQCIKGTGGGPGYSSFDPIVEAILKIINIKTVVGLHYSMDSDNCLEDLSTNIIDSPSHAIIECEPLPIFVVNGGGSEMEALPSCSSDWSENVPVMSKETCGSIQETTPKTPLEENGKNTPKSTLKRSLDADWSRYVPRKLKEPISKKLKETIPTSLGATKEEYYKLKVEYLKAELEEQKRN
ncbi:Myb/SANT-like DNA-binding domain [Popillia japonica]|uniref:Regulatory protein zeste n=1 Tax=Popillia japonica TaxID=7064 RepID=A0AAW1HFV0_POPJA